MGGFLSDFALGYTWKSSVSSVSATWQKMTKISSPKPHTFAVELKKTRRHSNLQKMPVYHYRSRPHGGSTAATTAHNTLNSHATHTLNSHSHTLSSHHSHTLSSSHGGQPDILKSTPDHQRIKWIENILKQWIWVLDTSWMDNLRYFDF